jgi:hypothetical protein
MLPAFLVPENTVREAGAGHDIELGNHFGEVLTLTLGITRIIEQESLDVSVWGSVDGTDWGTQPLLVFPQKFYCGTYQRVLDLAERPDVRFLRVKWQANRWGKGEPKPLFTFYVFAQEMKHQAMAVAV